jgi:hypothetical protein
MTYLSKSKVAFVLAIQLTLLSPAHAVSDLCCCVICTSSTYGAAAAVAALSIAGLCAAASETLGKEASCGGHVYELCCKVDYINDTVTPNDCIATNDLGDCSGEYFPYCSDGAPNDLVLPSMEAKSWATPVAVTSAIFLGLDIIITVAGTIIAWAKSG